MSLLRRGETNFGNESSEPKYTLHVRRAAIYSGGLALSAVAIKTGCFLWESSNGITDTPHTVGVIIASGVAISSLYASSGEMMQHVDEGLTHLENRLREQPTTSDIE